ncbi:ABC transporter permease [Brevibacterium sp. BRM-1]|uniref:FtsX-like permease family protein n=1 Tax=Brevibacterium sp. BRM-1 TaxID=2999062 RepID=UPI00227EF662|nr:FtsX-like permease family protein [Brevibacterium sp. BRM-1]WAL39534.1 ABC transporter permease [Brevibacterium sp. BRM-1]
MSAHTAVDRAAADRAAGFTAGAERDAEGTGPAPTGGPADAPRPDAPSAAARPAAFGARGSLATARRLVPLLVGWRSIASVPGMLMVAAFAACSALFLTVAGGLWAFLQWPPLDDSLDVLYKGLAAIATALLVVPAVTLGQSAATLSARREDERLSTLSLLGASRTTVTLVSLAEPLLMAALGTLAGIAGYLVLALPLSRIPFQGHGLGYDAMMLPWWVLLLAAAGLLLVSACSALVGLRRIAISPLGVRTKSLEARFPVGRIIAGALLVPACGIAVFVSKAGTTVAVICAGLFAMILLGMLLVDVLGVLFVRLVAWARGRRARSAHQLIAARLVSASPKQYWRRVSGLALTAFTATFAGTGVALIGAAGSEGLTGPERYLMDDILTGVLLTLGIAFLFIAASAVINQAADIYDRAATYRELHAAGMAEETVRRINVSAVMMPVVWVSAFAGGLGLFLVLPFAGMALVMKPATFLVLLGSIVVGALIVRAGLLVTNPLVRRVTLSQG